MNPISMTAERIEDTLRVIKKRRKELVEDPVKSATTLVDSGYKFTLQPYQVKFIEMIESKEPVTFNLWGRR